MGCFPIAFLSPTSDFRAKSRKIKILFLEILGFFFCSKIFFFEKCCVDIFSPLGED